MKALGTLLLFSTVHSAIIKYDINSLYENSEYNLEDILSRHRLLTYNTKQGIELFKNPIYDSSCIRNSLSPILSKCLKNSVDEIEPSLRARTAAKLSICEFEVAGIQYPRECYYKTYSYEENDVDYSDCIVALEETPQWWTTYSGNYRSIGEFCSQELLPFEKDEILNLFLNVTELYDVIVKDLGESAMQSANFKNETLTAIIKLRSIMNDLIKRSEETQTEYMSKMSENLKWTNELVIASSNLSTHMSESSAGVITDIASQIQGLQSEWGSFSFEINIIEELRRSIASLKQGVEEDVNETKSILKKSFDESVSKVIEMSYMFENSESEMQKLNEEINNSMDIVKVFKSELEISESSLEASTQYIDTILSSIQDLNQLPDLSELLAMSQDEFVNTIQDLTNIVGFELIKLSNTTTQLDKEVAALGNKIHEAAASLVIVNEILSNNFVIKSIISLGSILKIAFSRFSISIILFALLSYVTFFWMLGLLEFAKVLNMRRFLRVILLFFSALFGALLVGIMIIEFTLC